MAARKPAWLSKVKVVNDVFKKTRPQTSPVDVFIAGLDKQIKLVEWYENGKEDEKPNGKEWFFIKDGIAYTHLRYSVKKVFILGDEDTNSIYQVGTNYADLKAFFEGVKSSTEKGEFDSIIEKIAKDMTEERAKSRLENKLKKAEKEDLTPDSVQ